MNEAELFGSVSSFTPVRNVAYIRTSDRATFRRCRRKWNWTYVHRGNRQAAEPSHYLWFGTGFHWALEDFHGLKQFPSAAAAFTAYYEASKRVPGFALPPEAHELLPTGIEMLEYYEHVWLRTRQPLNTLVWNGVPQVEVRFEIELPIDVTPYGFDVAIYQGTFDRVIVDEYGRLWVVEYKTAKQFNDGHLDTDGQVNAYCWAARKVYGPDVPVAGVVYQQHKKNPPRKPELLKTTRALSVNKNQATSYGLYRAAMIEYFGSVEKAPPQNQEFLSYLAQQESGDSDPFIRRYFTTRNEAQIQAEEQKILLECCEMLDPGLPIYPNPTRDCSWDCEFKAACINMDDGSDWQQEIEERTVDRTEERDRWRQYLIIPGQERNPLALPNPEQ